MNSCSKVGMLAVLASLTACAANHANDVPVMEDPANVFVSDRPVSLGINGFNYTDLPITSFSINGQGGGGISVSSPTSGGSGTVCCINLHPGTRLPKPVNIRWMRYLNKKQHWCTKNVMLNGPIPDRPTNIGVHFMPDGAIEVEVTNGYPKLKLALEKFDVRHRKSSNNVIHDEQVAECEHGR